MFSGKVSRLSSIAHLHGEQRAGGEVDGEETVKGTFFLLSRRKN